MAENASITQESFKILLGWLDTNDESAGEKYEKIRQRLIRIFVGRGCYEAEILADRTIDRVIAKVPQISDGYVGDPAAYFFGVAQKIHLEWLRSKKREREAPVIELTAPVEEEGADYPCLETCLEKLPEDSREMILEYYRGDKRVKIDRRKELARKRGISIGALQIKASRIRAGLSKCVSDCVAAAN
jgi:DNA-directed RNA polymerase specialized sigma24 family protein